MIDETKVLGFLKYYHDLLSERNDAKHNSHVIGEMNGLALAMILIKREARRNGTF